MATQTAKRTRIKDLVPSDPSLPPARQVSQFVQFYFNHRDAKLAACQAALLPEMGDRLYRNPNVRAMIDKKIMLLDVEIAKQRAKAANLTVDALDAALVEEVKSKKNGHVRVRAIELGYRRTGMIREGEFYVAPDPNTNKNAPSIYRAQQTMVRRTVTEEVMHSEAQVLPVTPASDPIFSVKEY